MEFEQCFALSRSDKYEFRKAKNGEVNVSFFLDDGDAETTCTMPLDGVLDEFVVHIFKNGQCHALALALHDILGWPIVGLYETTGTYRHTSHFAVASPMGHVGCVDGLRRAPDYGRRNIDPALLRRSRKRGFVPLAHEFARHHAPQIARELLKQLDDSMWNPDWWKK